MRIVSRRALREFWSQRGQESALRPLDAWYTTVNYVEWQNFSDVRATYPSADGVGERVVFNVGGNKYRVVAGIDYARGIVYIKFVGTHAEYDEIDVRTVELRER